MHAEVKPLKIWLATPLLGEHRALVQEEFPYVEWLETSNIAVREQDLAQADVVYGSLAPSDVGKLHAARFIQSVCPLIPEPLLRACRAHRLPIASAASAFIPRTAERALAVLLASCHGLLGPSAPPMRLAGATVTIFGTGRLGQTVARLCQMLGVHVIGISDDARQVPYFDQLLRLDQCQRAVASSISLICCASESTDARIPIDAPVIDALPPASVIINLTRPEILDAEAFDTVSRAKRIRGFWLAPPGFYESPVLPASMVALPPIVSEPENDPEVVGLLLRNLHCLEAGLPCENLIQPPAET